MKTIGILGGMGPLATADLYRKIVLMTKAGSDNEHIRVYIDSNAQIPDRTAAILEGGEDPLPQMTSALRNLEHCGADCIILPCNTAHYFLPRLQELTDVPILSMPDAAALACAEKFAGKTAGILATKGTLSVGIYQKALENRNLSYVLPSESLQDVLMHIIYDGVKAGKPAAFYKDDWNKILNEMGADYYILGCTELPLAQEAAGCTVPAVDPTAEIAACAIKFCGYEVQYGKGIGI